MVMSLIGFFLSINFKTIKIPLFLNNGNICLSNLLFYLLRNLPTNPNFGVLLIQWKILMNEK